MVTITTSTMPSQMMNLNPSLAREEKGKIEEHWMTPWEGLCQQILFDIASFSLTLIDSLDTLVVSSSMELVADFR